MEKLYSDRQRFFNHVVELCASESPAYLARIGGSDTNALLDFLHAKDAGEAAMAAHLKRHLPLVEELNGFYDTSANKVDSYFRYLDLLRRNYEATEVTTFVHRFFLREFFPAEIADQFKAPHVPSPATLTTFMRDLVARENFVAGYPYTYIENLVRSRFTLFGAFSTALAGKKILVVCPFGESVLLNFRNRRGFFKSDYLYPEFEVDVVNTPITYGGMPDENYPHANWFETLDALCREISGKTFDIALLSCGSYAPPIGSFVKNELKRKAIYVGGILQLYFGIMGRRYQNPYFLSQINAENFISPVEKEKYLNMLPTSDVAAREAFGAYF
ncbi:MAG TPA: hypothetical protein VMU18_11130 [Rhodoblastus sp.]|nr:hypothetical protein [Rhodoblastus sp.]